MSEDVRRAGQAMGHLLVGAGLSLLCYLMFGLLLFTAIMTVIVVGAGVLPETVLLMRRVAGFERRRTAAWSGVPVPEAYAPLTGPLAQRVQTAATDPGTWRDLRWYAAHLLYGLALMYVGLLVFVVALFADGIWSGLLRRRPVLLPLVVRLAGTEAALARALLLPSPATAGMAERIERLTATRADAVAAHGAELRRIERDLHDGAQARLVALWCGSGWPGGRTGPIPSAAAHCSTRPRTRSRRPSRSCARWCAASTRRC